MADERILRREVHHHLHVERVLDAVARSTGGSCLKGSVSAGRTALAGMSSAHLLVLGGQAGFDVPIEGADALAAVAHQPIDVVLAFAHIERTLESRRCPCVRVDRGYGHSAGRSRPASSGCLIGSDAEDHGEQVVAAGQFLQRDADFVSG